jgi:RNA polymerase sigma-70 factor (ECF subfamily)
MVVLLVQGWGTGAGSYARDRPIGCTASEAGAGGEVEAMADLLVLEPPAPAPAPSRPAGRRRYGGAVAGDEREVDAAVREARATAAWLAAEPDAVRLAWEACGGLVHAYCARALGDRDRAADCTQETFVSAWRARERFDPARGSLAAWLLGIARHRVLDVFRGAHRVPTPVEELPSSGAPAPAPDVPEVLADQLLVAHALESLPPAARQVVELAFYGELTQVEIAERTGLPIGTVKSHMRRALLRLRADLEGGVLDG